MEEIASDEFGLELDDYVPFLWSMGGYFHPTIIPKVRPLILSSAASVGVAQRGRPFVRFFCSRARVLGPAVKA